jgi:site-specific DNA recombinase
MFSENKVDPQRVAIYIRWSTEEQGQGTTLEVQRDACRFFVMSQGWEFREDLVYVDDGVSGGTLNRPALSKLRQAVKSGYVGCIVVYKLDRLSRSLPDCVNLVRHEWSDVPLYSTKESFDTKSPVGQMIFNILVSFAEFERNVIRERTMSGKAKIAESGRWNGGVVPYGFAREQIGESNGKPVYELRHDTATAPIVREIFQRYAKGIGGTKIASQLNEMGIPSPTGGTWSSQTIMVILSNPFYIGMNEYGRTPRKRQYLSRKISAEGNHAAVVDKSLWDSVQALRVEKKGVSPRELGSNFLFSGVAHCSECGRVLSGSKKTWKTKNGTNYRREYRCRDNVSKGVCVGIHYAESDIEAGFLSAIESLRHPSDLREIVEMRVAAESDKAHTAALAREEAKTELRRVEQALAKLDRVFLEGETYSPTEYRKLKEEYTQRKVELEAVISSPVDDSPLIDSSMLQNIASRIRELWTSVGTLEEKRLFIKEFTRTWHVRIMVHPDRTVTLEQA